MKKISCRIVLAFSVCCITYSICVAVELPQTGQTGCYDGNGSSVGCSGTGQDGAWLRGEIWPTPRFTDHGDETITDNLTGLMWTKSGASPGVFAYSCSPASQETLTWSQALALVSCLNTRYYAGHGDWRLPNVVELQSLVHAGQSDSHVWLEAQGFIGLWLGYWSSTTHESDGTPQANIYAYTVSMLDGQVGIDWKESASYKFPAWPVRGNSDGPAGLWRTGQTTSFVSEDDGSLQSGAVWPSPRFVDEGDCVHDRLTGLLWSRDANLATGAVGWQQALDTANVISLCGTASWRLPNTAELRTLVHFGESDLELWLEGEGFENVQLNDPYWSSTTRAYQTNNAFGVRLDASTLYAFSKTVAQGGAGYVWAVSDAPDVVFEDGFESGNTSAWPFP